MQDIACRMDRLNRWPSSYLFCPQVIVVGLTALVVTQLETLDPLDEVGGEPRRHSSPAGKQCGWTRQYKQLLVPPGTQSFGATTLPRGYLCGFRHVKWFERAREASWLALHDMRNYWPSLLQSMLCQGLLNPNLACRIGQRRSKILPMLNLIGHEES